MAKNDEKQEEKYGPPNHNPDSAAYVLVPTKFALPDAWGDPPPFEPMDMVLKDSDDDDGKGREVHPVKNQPGGGLQGLKKDELPDTTGRSAPGRFRDEKSKSKK